MRFRLIKCSCLIASCFMAYCSSQNYERNVYYGIIYGIQDDLGITRDKVIDIPEQNNNCCNILPQLDQDHDGLSLAAQQPNKILKIQIATKIAAQTTLNDILDGLLDNLGIARSNVIAEQDQENKNDHKTQPQLGQDHDRLLLAGAKQPNAILREKIATQIAIKTTLNDILDNLGIARSNVIAEQDQENKNDHKIQPQLGQDHDRLLLAGAKQPNAILRAQVETAIARQIATQTTVNYIFNGWAIDQLKVSN